MSVIHTYSKLAAQYESPENINSFWGKIAEESFSKISIKENASVVVEVGCGPGLEFASLVECADPSIQFIAVEPAENLRKSAAKKVETHTNAKVLDGKFEELPIESDSVDYLYSILAFHWNKDMEKSVSELARVLKADGQMDLFFVGRDTGKDFMKKISPIYFKKLSARQVMDMASERQRLTVEQTEDAFKLHFADRKLSVTESSQTYFDTPEGHWSWWCRIEGQFAGMSEQTREECNKAARQALDEMNTDKGVPYTSHILHVHVG